MCREAVEDLQLHPSGKVALTVARDRTLRLWDLVKGCIAFTMQLEKGRCTRPTPPHPRHGAPHGTTLGA